MKELPEQECKGIDIHAVLKADERAAQAAAAAAATAVTTSNARDNAREALGRQIPQCAPNTHAASIPPVTSRLVRQAEARQTKVGELAHGVGRVEQSIIRLDVAVQDAVRVEEAQPACQLHGDANLLVVQGWAWRRIHQRAAERRLRCDRR